MPTINPVIVETDKFSDLLDRTNAVIEVINDNVLIAVAGSSTPRTGDVSLQGTLESDEFVAQNSTTNSLSVDTLVNRSNPVDYININSPLRVDTQSSSSQEDALALKTNEGFRPIIGLINGSARKWEMRLETPTDETAFNVVTGVGVNPQLRIEQDGTLTATKFSADGLLVENINASTMDTGTIGESSVPNLDANKITSGTFTAERIPNIDANKITSGIFAAERMPDLAASKITSGIFTAERIPNLDASKITSGTFTAERMPDLAASKITSGTINSALLPPVGDLPASATRSEIRFADLTNPNSSEEGFITGRRFMPAISNRIYTIVSGAQYAVGFTNQIGSFNDGSNYFDVFPPTGRTMSNLVAFMPSIHVIHFNGKVDNNDSMRCTWSQLGDRIRVYVQNTEQRSTPAANYFSVWTSTSAITATVQNVQFSAGNSNVKTAAGGQSSSGSVVAGPFFSASISSGSDFNIVSSSVRLGAEIRSSSAGNTATLIIFRTRNGSRSAVSALTTTSTSYTLRTVDIAVEEGDLFEFFIQGGATTLTSTSVDKFGNVTTTIITIPKTGEALTTPYSAQAANYRVSVSNASAASNYIR